MIEIIIFMTLPIALGIVFGSLIYLFLEEKSQNSSKESKKSMSEVIREMDEKALEDDISLEMADLRKRLSPKKDYP